MTKFTSYIRRLTAKLVKNRDGAVSVIAAVSFTAMVGFVGLGTEASYWYVKKRNLQGAVDSASFSAVAAMMNGETWASGTPGASARAIAAQYGLVNGANDGIEALDGENRQCAVRPGADSATRPGHRRPRAAELARDASDRSRIDVRRRGDLLR